MTLLNMKQTYWMMSSTERMNHPTGYYHCGKLESKQLLLLLKLVGYGLLRVYIILIRIGIKLNFIWFSTRIFGGTLVRIICIRQTDLKSLIAYYSIAHIGIVIGGLITLIYRG